MNFWQDIKNKNGIILCLAPMADVTDAAFRFVISKYSKFNGDQGKINLFLKNQHLDKPVPRSFSGVGFVTYTEFVSADGLVRAPEAGRKKLLKDLEYSEIERPIVAQFFTSKPDMMEKAAALAVELGFDGVDINMGCPDKSIEKQNAGAALMKNPKLAREIIAAAKQGTKNKIPVSVKTRLGYNKDELETWLPELLAENPTAIIIHARTRKEMSKVPARWERIKRAVEIRNKIQNFSTPQPQKCTDIFLLENSSCSPQSGSQGISDVVVPKNSQKTLIIGNGDVADTDDARRKCEETGADGAMLGRAVFGNPFLFSELRKKKRPEQSEGQVTAEKKLQVLLEHTKLFEQKFKGIKNFSIMKKHFKEYLKNPSLRDLRFKLMRTENAKEVEEIISNFGFPAK
jgi:tRNA-dihydrouridine synthase